MPKRIERTAQTISELETHDSVQSEKTYVKCMT
jgi:hypothetical protein